MGHTFPTLLVSLTYMFAIFLVVVVMRLGRVLVVQYMLTPSCGILGPRCEWFYAMASLCSLQQVTQPENGHHHVQFLGQRTQTHMFD